MCLWEKLRAVSSLEILLKCGHCQCDCDECWLLLLFCLVGLSCSRTSYAA